MKTRAANGLMQRLPRANRWALLVVAALAGGCVMPPDLMSPPRPAPAPAIERDRTVTAAQPVASVFMEQARTRPEAHRLVLLETGDDALLARIHLIRAARESIDIQTFIWVYDRSGSWVYRELLAAARRGVLVRVLVDQFVPPGISAEEYAALATAHANLEIRLFRPVSGNAITSDWSVVSNTFTRFQSLNRRMHNKVLLIDGQAAILGGRNFQDAYFDRDPVLCFRDRDVLVSGPVCAPIRESFEEFWNYRQSYEAIRLADLRSALENGRPRKPQSVTAALDPFFAEIDRLANVPDLEQASPALRAWEVRELEYLSDGPEYLRRFRPPWRDNPFEPLMAAMRETRQELLIETPYSVIGSKSYRLLRKIRKEQPEARLRMSTNSMPSADHLAVAGVALKQRRMQIRDLQLELHLARAVPGDIRLIAPRYDTLLREAAAGADPNWEADPDILDLDIEGPRFCVHGKSMVVDRKVSFVGSHNFDPRSFNLNTECGVLIRDEPFARHLASVLELAMQPQNSWVVAERRYPPVVAELNSLLNRISSALPFLDIWPLEQVSCYELREGFQPLSPYHPDFHRHYEDVGPLPGVDIGLRTVQVQLIRSLGGFTSPLM